MKGNRSEEKESYLLFVHVTYVITNFQLMYHFIARFTRKAIRHLNTATHSLVWLFIRQLGSDNLDVRHLASAHMRSFDRCVGMT